MFNYNKRTLLHARNTLLPFCIPAPTELPDNVSIPSPEYWEDWARDQGVIAILYRNLKDCNLLDRVDAESRSRIEVSFLDCVFQDKQICEIARQIAGAAQVVGLDVILLKGISIGRKYYPEPSIRPSGDIDLLIRRDDIDKFKELLLFLNFVMERPDLEDLRRTRKSELRFIAPGSSLVIEIHWDFVNSESLRKNLFFPEESLWAEAETMMLDDVPIKVLATEHLVVYHCIHMAHHHQMNRLIWFIDLFQIARYSNEVFQSPAFWERCLESNGARLAVAACMRFTRQIFPFMPDFPEIEKLLPERYLTRILLNLINSSTVLLPESYGLKYRQKLFREGLKLRA